MSINEFEIDANLIEAANFGAAANNTEATQQAIEQQRLDEESEDSETAGAVQQNDKRKATGAPTQDEEAKLEDDPNTPEHEDLKENDPRRDGVGWNLADIWAEGSSAVVGGLRDTASSAITLPERIGDMFSGEMEAEGEDYAPDFDPLGGDNNPITKTWWGNVLRGIVHFTSTGAAITAGIAALPVSGGAATATGVVAAGTKSISYLQRLEGLRKVGSGALGWKKMMAFDAAIGGSADLVSEYSQDENALGALKQHFPALDTPLATNDQDSPMVMTAKNVMEGLGIGFAAGGLLLALGKALGGRFKGKPTKAAGDKAARAQSKRATLDANAKEAQQLELDLPERTPVERALDEQVANRQDVDEQIKEMGYKQLELPGFGGYKSKYVLADDDMANPIPRGRTHTVMKQLDEIDNNGFDGELGSTYATVTPAQVKNSNEYVEVDDKTMRQIMQRALGEDRYKRMLEDAAKVGMTARDVHYSAHVRMQKVLEGRNTSGKSAEQYWDEIMEGQELDRYGGMDAWSMENVIFADYVNATNIKQMRDYAIAAREGNTVFDVWDTDGPVAAIRDRLIYGMVNVKKSRMLISNEFRKLQTVEGQAKANKYVKERLGEIKNEVERGIDLMIDAAVNGKSKALQDALLEAFSMSNKIQNWEDLDQYFRTRLYGGTVDGRKQTGLLIKELQGVTVNSILSGPKTPVRALSGTSIAAFARPISQAIGGAVTLDGKQMRMGIATTSAMLEAIPEAWTLFKARLNSYWTQEVSTIKSRYADYDQRNQDWEAMMEWVKERGTDGQKAAALWGNMARGLNNNSFLTYSSKLMAATDDAFGHIMARARARMEAMDYAMAKQSETTGVVTVIDKKLMADYEADFMRKITNEDGTINFDENAALKYMQEEATLTRDLSGFSQGLDALFKRTPWAKPFFLFAQTGINGLELTMKYMPGVGRLGFNQLVESERRIFNATAEMANSKKLLDIGIENAQELENAKAIQKGRQVIGNSLVTMAAMAFMSDRLTGNGPVNTQQKRAWEAAGYVPRSIKLGNVWVSYDTFEPFNSILAYIADVGDNSQLMGEEWAEGRLARVATVLAQGTVSKSYLSGIGQLVNLFSNPADVGKVAANLMNNQIPLGGIRNELGRLFNPYMKELNSDLWTSIRNRNQLTELIAGDPLPIKYDFLNGKPIKDHSFPVRMFNMFSPVQLNLENSPGRTLLFNSGYDLNFAVYANPDGVNLKDYPEIRSMYQRAMGEQNLEAKLNEFAKRPAVIESLKQLEKDRNAGDLFGKEPRSYLVNDLISNMFLDAQRKAWYNISQDPKVQKLIEAEKKREASEASQLKYPDAANDRYREAQELLRQTRNK